MANANGMHIQSVASVALQHQHASQPCTLNATIGAPRAERAAYSKPESVSNHSATQHPQTGALKLALHWMESTTFTWPHLEEMGSRTAHWTQRASPAGRNATRKARLSGHTHQKAKNKKNVNGLDWQTRPKADGAMLLPPLTLARADGVPLLAHLLVKLRSLQDANEHEYKATPGAKDLHRPARALRRKRGELATVTVA